jgi:starvation-inducible DNA-binding protein
MEMEHTQSSGRQSQGQSQPRRKMPDGQSPASPTQAAGREISKENQPNNAVVMQLQRQVANAYILYTNYKHYHWNTYGPLFRDLHLLFDEFANAVLKTADEFAERVRMIGQDPIFSPMDIVETASVKPADPANSTMRDMITEADRHLLVVIKEMREGVRAADAEDDPGTADLFTQAVQIHEKHEWWLRDILEKRDGLTV